MASYTSHDPQDLAADRAARAEILAARDEAAVIDVAMAVAALGTTELCRRVRESLEDDEYDDTRGAWIQPELIAGSGVVTPPSDVRFSRAYASSRAGRLTWAHITSRDAHMPPETLAQIPTWGYALVDDPDTRTILAQLAEAGDSTVLVSIPGQPDRVVPTAQYRRLRRDRRTARTTTAAPLHSRTMAADLPGDIDIAQGQ